MRTKHSRWKLIKSYIGWEDYIAASLILLGAIGYFEGPIPFIPHLTDFYVDIRSDLIGIGITVLIIDNVNEMYRRRAEKERLILQMGSPDHGFAIEAVRQLEQKRWLYDGSLRGAYLWKANLQGANLMLANLEKAHLVGANLEKANLGGADLMLADLMFANLQETSLLKADLRGADLGQANLGGADLMFANLQGTNLFRAHLEKANLAGANLKEVNLSGADFGWLVSGEEPLWKNQLASVKSLDGATMPDGKVYDPAIHELTKNE
jgi:hypothetical protein